MKLSQAEIDQLSLRLRSGLEKQRLTVTEVGRLARVHPSQVGRICRGEFRTMSYNVREVCRVLGLGPAPEKPATSSDATWALLERELRELSKESPGRAKQLAKVMEAMTKLALH
jgi:hypothetical protein